ncbi:hypothetical protein [Colwellia sp. BRX10-4]|uniref:hypothetical protein n=1 Tax=Colwellia sp. BRX10-4 TaxID=2759843 RepID=UPI001C70D3D3|nr:hypothetical protein [Colwellia sp. BRX10-4]
MVHFRYIKFNRERYVWKTHNQAVAAAQSGMSERTARRIESGQHSTTHLPRVYRIRKDPFNGPFEEHLVPLLKADPELQPITLLDQLDTLMPGKFGHNHLRTLQRRVKKWLATEGPEQEVIFRQKYMPGFMGISDYTWMNKLEISIAGQAFSHKLFHYKLVLVAGRMLNLSLVVKVSNHSLQVYKMHFGAVVVYHRHIEPIA